MQINLSSVYVLYVYVSVCIAYVRVLIVFFCVIKVYLRCMC